MISLVLFISGVRDLLNRSTKINKTPYKTKVIETVVLLYRCASKKSSSGRPIIAAGRDATRTLSHKFTERRFMYLSGPSRDSLF